MFMIQAVSSTLNKKWDFKMSNFCWHGMKAYGSHKWNPNTGKGTSTATKGTPFSFWKSYYVSDAAFLFLNRENIEHLLEERFDDTPGATEDGDSWLPPLYRRTYKGHPLAGKRKCLGHLHKKAKKPQSER
jgi:hypothetical protein